MSLPDYLEKHIEEHTKHFGADPNKIACSSLSKKDKLHKVDSTGCHAGVRTNNNIPWEYIISSICRKYRKNWNTILPVDSPKYREAEETYIDYLINHSPWANIFPIKDPGYLIDKGVWIVSAEHPSNLVVGSLIASRSLTEAVYRTIVFNDLVKCGVKNKDMAFLVAEMSSLSSDSSKKTPYISYGIVGSAHSSILAALINPQTLNNFLAHKPQIELENYSVRNTYDSIHDTFVSGEVSKASSFFHNKLFPRLKTILDGKEETGPQNNPFTKAKEVLAEADQPFTRRSFKYTEEHLSKLVQAVNEITPEEYL